MLGGSKVEGITVQIPRYLDVWMDNGVEKQWKKN